MEGPEKSTLYLSLSETKPMDDSARLALRGNSGPGLSEVDPVVFVIDKGAAEKRPKLASNAGSNELPASKIEQRYGAPFVVLFSKMFKLKLTSVLPTLRR